MQFKIFALFLCLNFSLPAMAETDDVLGPYPALGSLEDIADLNQILFYQKTRTAADCVEAQSEATANLDSFYGKLLSPSELKIVKTKLKWLTAKTGVQIYYQKQKFRRPRPYMTHSEIKPCINLESSKAYPSGHATLARVYAGALSVMYPERSLQFYKKADKVALNRVIGGVHHPSDIEAGKKLGDSILKDYFESDNNAFYSLKEAH